MSGFLTSHASYADTVLARVTCIDGSYIFLVIVLIKIFQSNDITNKAFLPRQMSFGEKLRFSRGCIIQTWWHFMVLYKMDLEER